jgi:hypothetical protein
MEKSLTPPNNTGYEIWTKHAIQVRQSSPTSKRFCSQSLSPFQILADTTTLAWKPEWQSLLSNGTVNNPASPPNNLTGIVYGEFYPVLYRSEPD